MDSNVILELLLDQARADEVERFLRETPRDKLHISEFGLYSLGVILFQRKLPEVYLRMAEDLLQTGEIGVFRLGVEDIQVIAQTAKRFNLDFDDAYQYVVAEKYDLTIVSFDHHFDRTGRGRKTPAELLPG